VNFGSTEYEQIGNSNKNHRNPNKNNKKIKILETQTKISILFFLFGFRCFLFALPGLLFGFPRFLIFFILDFFIWISGIRQKKQKNFFLDILDIPLYITCYL
jgi:hypothetical protein